MQRVSNTHECTAKMRGESSARQVVRIVEALEEDIVLGRLHPRERLIEDEMLERFGGKRHVVREAFSQLERMGLVERLPNRGASVRAYGVDEVEQLYSLRMLLEAEAASTIPLPLLPAALDRLKEIQRRHDQAVDESDLSEVFRANLAFHRALFENCENRFLAAAIADFAQKTHGVRFHSLTDKALLTKARDEHKAMIAAIERRDRDKLVTLCRQHLPPSKNAYLRTYRSPGT